MHAMLCLIVIVSCQIMNKRVLQVARMILSLEHCVFMVKGYHETHLLKHFCNDSIQEFLNSVSPYSYSILNSLKEIENHGCTNFYSALLKTFLAIFGGRVNHPFLARLSSSRTLNVN